MNGTLSSASDRDTGNLVRERANAALFVRYGTWRVRTYGVRNMSVVESVQIYYIYLEKNILKYFCFVFITGAVLTVFWSMT